MVDSWRCPTFLLLGSWGLGLASHYSLVCWRSLLQGALEGYAMASTLVSMARDRRLAAIGALVV